MKFLVICTLAVLTAVVLGCAPAPQGVYTSEDTQTYNGSVVTRVFELDIRKDGTATLRASVYPEHGAPTLFPALLCKWKARDGNIHVQIEMTAQSMDPQYADLAEQVSLKEFELTPDGRDLVTRNRRFRRQ